MSKGKNNVNDALVANLSVERGLRIRIEAELISSQSEHVEVEAELELSRSKVQELQESPNGLADSALNTNGSDSATI